MKIVICGCGALGSQIAMLLAKEGREFILFDDDVVEMENLDTSAYRAEQVGQMKAVALAEMLWKEYVCVGIPTVETVECHADFYLPEHYTYWSDVDVIVDSFDNGTARVCTCTPKTIHVGVTEDRVGIIEWNSESYADCLDDAPRGENPICTHELGAAILSLTAALATWEIEEYLTSGNRTNSIVFENGKVEAWEAV